MMVGEHSAKPETDISPMERLSFLGMTGVRSALPYRQPARITAAYLRKLSDHCCLGIM
jgi:hypothetical protein